jgi:hypothetical protein
MGWSSPANLAAVEGVDGGYVLWDEMIAALGSPRPARPSRRGSADGS